MGFWSQKQNGHVTDMQKWRPSKRMSSCILHIRHGRLTRYGNLRVAHAPGMSGTFVPQPRVSNPDMQHGTCVTYVPWSMQGSQPSGFVWSRWRGKRCRHSRCMRNPQFAVFGNRPTYTIPGASAMPQPNVGCCVSTLLEFSSAVDTSVKL